MRLPADALVAFWGVGEVVGDAHQVYYGFVIRDTAQRFAEFWRGVANYNSVT